MFVFDIETCGISSESVILSASILYFDHSSNPSFKDLYESALFVKFNAKEQINKYKRKIRKDTMEWWEKQPLFAKKRSLYPTDCDISAAEGITAIKDYMKEYSDPKNTLIWIRGSLDQMCFDSLCFDVGVDSIAPYANYRDVRTAIDILASESRGGYCSIIKEGFNRDDVLKHDPVSDVCLDAMMLMYHPT